jgi:hypothetical protein
MIIQYIRTLQTALSTVTMPQIQEEQYILLYSQPTLTLQAALSPITLLT